MLRMNFQYQLFQHCDFCLTSAKMQKELILSLIFISSVSLKGSLAQLEIIETTTSFTNYLAEVLSIGNGMIFKAPTCGHYDTGYNFKVKVYNPLNPRHDANLGLTYFSVSNKLINGTNVPAADVLCAVYPNTTQYNTECSAPAGKGDLYVYVIGNNRPFINFALTVDFQKATPQLIGKPAVKDFPFPSYKSVAPVQELRQVVNYDRRIELPYLNTSLIHLRFCPTKLTGAAFTVQSIFQADDDQAKSIIAQAMCNIKNCTFDTPEPARIGENIYDLPVSVATSKAGAYKDVYIYAVAFNGEWRSEDEAPVGKFRFGATIGH